MQNITDMYYTIYTAGEYKTHNTTFRKQTAFVISGKTNHMKTKPVCFQNVVL